MSSERQKAGPFIAAAFGAIAVIAYGYAFLYEVPGQVSTVGLIALGTGTACLLFILAYVLLRWYQGRSSSRSDLDALKGNRNGT